VGFSVASNDAKPLLAAAAADYLVETF